MVWYMLLASVCSLNSKPCLAYVLAHSKCLIHDSDYYQAPLHDIGSAQWMKNSGLYDPGLGFSVENMHQFSFFSSPLYLLRGA